MPGPGVSTYVTYSMYGLGVYVFWTWGKPIGVCFEMKYLERVVTESVRVGVHGGNNKQKSGE